MKASVRSTLVCFALPQEATVFQRRVAGRREIITLVTGIGRGNAEAGVRKALASFRPDGVLTCGYAGGLNPELHLGDVLFATDNDALAQRLRGAGAVAAKFYCSSRVATTAVEKAELRRATDADAVEMESEAIQTVCRERGIPCATVRVISDAAGEDLPLDFNRLAKADLNLDYGKLAVAIAKSPKKIPALMKLQKQTRMAAAALADVLVRVV